MVTGRKTETYSVREVLCFCRYKVKLSLCIIKHSVKKVCVGEEVWFHEVFNLGYIRGSNTERGLDSFVMQH